MIASTAPDVTDQQAIALFRLARLASTSRHLDVTLAAIAEAALALTPGEQATIRLADRNDALVVQVVRGTLLATPGALLSAPIRCDGRLLGVLELAAEVPGALGAEHDGLTGELAALVAAAVVRSQQAELVEHLQRELLENQKLAMLAEVAHGLTHELNTPLGVIVSNLSVLQEYAVAVTEFTRVSQQAIAQLRNNEAPYLVAEALASTLQSTDLPYIVTDLPLLTAESASSGERITGIVRAFTAFGRQVPNALSAVQVEDELDAAVLLVWSTLKHRAQLVRHYSAVPTVAGQLSDLAQVFARVLLKLATTLPSVNGTLTLTTAADATHVLVTLGASGGSSGAGQLSAAFDPLSRTTQGAVSGSLGVDVCRGILAGFGGSMTLECTSVLGASVTLRLPIARSCGPGKGEASG